jgi:pyruvate/2-oxoglutarate dehydrogenase complex dihydrolipoamide acyltransferase (E2) component
VEREANAGDTWDIVPGDSADFATELFGVPRDATLEPHVEPMAPDDEEPESSEFAAWLDTEPEAPVIAPQADEPEQDWQQWSDDAVRARDEQAARAAALTMRVTLALGEAQKMRESLAREWRASGVKPSTEDVVLRAAARAFRELPFVQTGAAMLRSFENRAENACVLSNAASRPFRDAVESMALDDGSEADFVLTAYGEVGIEEATPSLEAGQVLVLALGCERVEPLWDGERFLPAVSAALTLAYEPGELGDALAARFLARLHELVESPYALLAD